MEGFRNSLPLKVECPLLTGKNKPFFFFFGIARTSEILKSRGKKIISHSLRKLCLGKFGNQVIKDTVLGFSGWDVAVLVGY